METHRNSHRDELVARVGRDETSAKLAKTEELEIPLSDEIDCWTVGDATITRVIEFETGGFPPGFMFAGLTEERVKSIDWLHPHYADPDGTIRYSVQAFVVELQGRRIIVDTCVGNDKERGNAAWNHLKLPFLERLTTAGFPPDSIDTLLCTHLHLDHVGWNTRWDGSKWIPTFPNARYLFGRKEFEHWTSESHTSGDMPDQVIALAEQDVVMVDSVLPILNAGLHDLVESDHKITEEVSLFPSPGHSPGHVSVSIRSRGAEAVITGDVVHNPIQFTDPSICANFDFDRKVALATRQSFINDHADRDVLVLGTHFPTPAVGHIVRDGDGWRFIADRADRS